MKTYSSPEVVEVGGAGELVCGPKQQSPPDNDGSGTMYYPPMTAVDVD